MPSYSDIAQILTALAAVGGLIISWSNSRKIEEVHKATNSMKDELVAVTKSDAFQTGITEGRALQKSENSD